MNSRIHLTWLVIIMKNNGYESKLLMLKCDGVATASAAVVAIMKDILPTVVQDYSEIMEDGVSSAWMDESYATKAYDVLKGKKLSGSLEAAVESAATKAENFMSSMMIQNHAELQGISNGWLVDDVKVLRRLGNLWVVQVTGAKFPF